MATIDELSAALVKADAAGNAADAKAFADEIRRLRASSSTAAPSEIPGPRGAPPAWAAEYPGLYQTAVTARQLAGPTVEMLGGLGGALVGGAGGTFGGGPIGTAVGGITGAGLGYGAAKQGLRAVDVALGLEKPDTLGGEFKRAAENVAEGTAYELGGRLIPAVLGPTGNWLARQGTALAGTISDLPNLSNRLAAEMARKSLGTPAQQAAARKALQQAEAEGLDLTAQQALARGGVISPSAQGTIEKAVKTTSAIDPRALKEAAQEAARKSTIKGVTPDLDAAVTARHAAAAPFYKAADEAVVPLDAELSGVMARMPSGTIAAAAEIAKREGRPFIMGKAEPERLVETALGTKEVIPAKVPEITGESLHYIKRALSDIAYGPTAATGAGQDAQRAAGTLLKDFIKVFETKVPAYGEARRIYSDMSAPVNQAQVLKEMLSVLEKPGGGERIGPFLNVLGRGEQAMLKRAGGRGAPRYEALEEVLTPEQIGKVREVAKQLETEAAINQQITAGQQRATDLIKDELPKYRLPNIFNIYATTANRFLDLVGKNVSQKTIQTLADASLSAKTFDDLMSKLPAEERSKVLKTINDPSTWSALKPAFGKALMGVTAETPPMPPMNNLAPQKQPENALAR